MHVLCPVYLSVVGETRLGCGCGSFNLMKFFVGYIRIFISFPVYFCLCSPVNWLGIILYFYIYQRNCLLIRPLVHLSRHSPSSSVNCKHLLERTTG